MNKLLIMTCAAAMAFSANAWEKAITDTLGYIVQNADDTYGQSSIINGAHFPSGAPIAGNAYLVNSGYYSRSPGVNDGVNEFKGDSLTLDEGATLLLKGPGSKLTIADLRIYNAMISQGDGNCRKTLKGAIKVYGKPSAPSIFIGSGNSGVRHTHVESSISGASGTGIKVMHSDENDSPGAQFYTHFAGNNSGYAGSIEVESAGNGVCLVGYNNNAFGSTPNITLTNNGKIFGGGSGTVTLSGATITLNKGGLFGVYSKSGGNVGFEITGDSTISGSGTLTINNSGVEGSHWRRVALGNVAITGIDGIQVNQGLLQLNAGYDNPAVPIVVTAPIMLRTTGGCHAGPVTLQNGSSINAGADNTTLASLTLEQNSDNVPYIAKIMRSAPALVIEGNLVNNMRSGNKIRLSLTEPASVVHMAATNSYRILTAANLGTTGGLSPDDFEVVEDSGTVADSRSYIAGGTLSFEEADGKTYLVYALPMKVVCLNGRDSSGNAAEGSSFLTGGRWSDGKVPHADAAYFVPDGKLLRAPDNEVATFPNTSLAILKGGSFSAQQTTVTVNDLRMYGGSTMNATRNYGNRVAGNITVYGSAIDPVLMILEVAKAQTPEYRPLYIDSNMSGSGSVHFCYNPSAASDHAATDGRFGRFHLNGNNAGFSGEWQIAHWCIKTVFANAAAVGSASAIHFKSNGVCWVQDSYTIPAATGVNVDAAGSVAGDEDKTNGGTFEVDAGKVLDVAGVVSGGGILRKTGAGALRLDAENTISTAVVVKEGFIGGAGKVTAVELEDGAGFDVSATQATPFEIGTLTVDGGITLNIRDAAGVDVSRIAVAKVETLTGTLGNVKATVDGGRGGTYRLSVEGGILYAAKRGMIISLR